MSMAPTGGLADFMSGLQSRKLTQPSGGMLPAGAAGGAGMAASMGAIDPRIVGIANFMNIIGQILAPNNPAAPLATGMIGAAQTAAQTAAQPGAMGTTLGNQPQAVPAPAPIPTPPSSTAPAPPARTGAIVPSTLGGRLSLSVDEIAALWRGMSQPSNKGY